MKTQATNGGGRRRIWAVIRLNLALCVMAFIATGFECGNVETTTWDAKYHTYRKDISYIDTGGNCERRTDSYYLVPNPDNPMKGEWVDKYSFEQEQRSKGKAGEEEDYPEQAGGESPGQYPGKTPSQLDRLPTDSKSLETTTTPESSGGGCR